MSGAGTAWTIMWLFGLERTRTSLKKNTRNSTRPSAKKRVTLRAGSTSKLRARWVGVQVYLEFIRISGSWTVVKVELNTYSLVELWECELVSEWLELNVASLLLSIYIFSTLLSPPLISSPLHSYLLFSTHIFSSPLISSLLLSHLLSFSLLSSLLFSGGVQVHPIRTRRCNGFVRGL